MRGLCFLFPLLLAGCAAVSAPQTVSAGDRAAIAIIDVHRHGSWPDANDAEVRDAALAEMDANHVAIGVVALTDYDDVASWEVAAPDRFVSAVALGCPRNDGERAYWCFPSTRGWVDLAWLEGQIDAGRIEAIHEVLSNYNGIPISDARYAPYLALAAEHDLPVGIHTGRGPAPDNPPRSEPGCCPGYDPAAGDPALLRPVLARHPDLRIWIQHVGAGPPDHPYHWDEALALLRDYPNIYVDLSISNSIMPIAQYEATLRRLIDAGFADRIMFASDNLPLAPILARLNAIEWVSDAQRRAILHDNAARFFRIGDAR